MYGQNLLKLLLIFLTVILPLGVKGQADLFPPEARDEFAAAERLFRARRYGDALEAYTALSERYPTAVAAHVGRALSAFQLGRLEIAEEAYQQALALRPDDPVLLGGLGDVYRRAERLVEAQKAYERAIQLAGERSFPTWFLGLGILADRSGDYARAEALYRQAIEKDPNLAPAWHNLGMALFRQGRLEEAETVLRRAVSMRPDSADSFYVLGTIAQKRGEWYAARDLIRRAIELKSSEPTFHYALAQVLFRLGDREGGEAALRRYRRTKAQRYHEEAVQDMQSERFLDALSKLQNAVKTDPEYLPARLDRAYCLMRIGELEEADAGFQEVLQVDPHQPSAWLGRGLIAAEQGRYDEADALFLRAIQEDPNLAEGYRQLARLRELRGDLAGAEEAYSLGIAHYPNWGPGYWLRGRLRQKRGDLAGAEADYQKAIQIAPEQPAPRHALALLWLEEGHRLQEARELLQSALAQQEDPVLRTTFARIEAALGRADQARKEIERAYAHAPQDPYVVEWYRKLTSPQEDQEASEEP